MAKQALTWPDDLPPSEKHETKVVRLLRSGGNHWGVTESQAEFVYPRSLRPLRKIAGRIQEDGAATTTNTPVMDWKGGNSTQQGLEVSALLDEVFPTVVEMKSGDERLAGGGVCAGSSAAAAADAADLANGCVAVDGKSGGNNGKSIASKTASVGLEGGTGKARGGGGRRGKAKKKLARPTFYPYGNGNTAPSAGGVVYGGYMLSHSISPQV